MTTLGTMKARIADELGQRSDLTTQIAYAISDAIAAYQNERFHFNEGRTLTFSTVAGQEFYSAADAAGVALIWAIDYVMLFVGDSPYRLHYMDPQEMEGVSSNATNTGQPGWFTWYGDQMRIYPAPSGVWTIRIGCAASVAAPATDDEANNPWMTHAERLIRSRAKLELAVHVLLEESTANGMGAAVADAFRQLKDKTTKRIAAPRGRVAAMRF